MIVCGGQGAAGYPSIVAGDTAPNHTIPRKHVFPELVRDRAQSFRQRLAFSVIVDHERVIFAIV
jgi:hypothetical protein